ncbi:MarR family winged helix-turn-helix transcriptional regulator [Teichococcus aestuarii]|uniref:MarR family transcriptional regulator n=1 Tax=Teichococcus aestuarii TaxID=568898 RepID=A0A2U1V6Y9_9PROT|nr:MarR family transcriptional regulator [Pseudoroseomonas aestuarii]PWC29687.1 MarR family transcriptional regulator [Pseudoroseomonas aestuarii]
MPQPLPELTDHLGYRIRQVSNHVSHAFARKLAARGVTVAEWALLRMLYGQPPLPPSQLATRMGMTRGAITRLADRLIGKGLLLRAPSAADGRAQTLGLTESATAFVPELAGLADRNEAECFAHLSPAERETLRDLLERTVARLGITGVAVE